jgi:type III secretion protein N (ATPase)
MLSPRLVGRLLAINESTLKASLTNVKVGDLCALRTGLADQSEYAEVLSVDQTGSVLMPFGEPGKFSLRTHVEAVGGRHEIRVGPQLLGRVLNGFGDLIDEGPAMTGGVSRSVSNTAPLALDRERINEPMPSGVRAIDGLTTLGRGQRIGVFAPAGTGKSTLFGMMARGCSADVVVLALIGERGREVREFLEREIDEHTRSRCVTVVATADRSPGERFKAAAVAMTVAEAFREQGKQVLVLIDSLTRVCRAHRDVLLGLGRAPVRGGYPAAVMTELPRLLERAGPGKVGSITGIFTVLTEGDGTLDLLGEEIRSLIDGHIELSRRLAQHQHYPAVDVLRSISRLMTTVVPPQHKAAAGRMLSLLAAYEEAELLIQVGEYKPGADKLVDEAVRKKDLFKDFLRQPVHERSDFAQTVARLMKIVSPE